MSRRERESLTSPTQGAELQEDEDSVKPELRSAAPQTDQLTTLAFVLSTLMFVFSLYVAVTSFVYMLDWFGEWRTDKFRWGRLMQGGLGVAMAAVSVFGVQSAYAGTPAVRQLRLGGTRSLLRLVHF